MRGKTDEEIIQLLRRKPQDTDDTDKGGYRRHAEEMEEKIRGFKGFQEEDKEKTSAKWIEKRSK